MSYVKVEVPCVRAKMGLGGEEMSHNTVIYVNKENQAWGKEDGTRREKHIQEVRE